MYSINQPLFLQRTGFISKSQKSLWELNLGLKEFSHRLSVVRVPSRRLHAHAPEVHPLVLQETDFI